MRIMQPNVVRHVSLAMSLRSYSYQMRKSSLIKKGINGGVPFLIIVVVDVEP